MKYLSFAALAVAALIGAPAVAQQNLTAETASPGGAAYLTPSHLTEVAAARGIANIQLTDGQTLTNSIQNVAEGKTDISATPYILPFLMSRGVGPYGKLGKEKGAELAGNLRALYPYQLGIFFLYAYDAKNVGGWDDIAGRKIFNGPPRGGALTNARTMIQIATGLKDGDGYEGVQTNWGQAGATISGGSVDAVVLPELFPGSRLSSVGAAGKMTAWSLPKEKFELETMQKYMRAPGSAPVDLSVAELREVMGEGWSFVTEDDRFRGMATVGGDVVNKDMDEELAYQLTKAHIETLDALKAKAPFASNVGYADLSESATSMCGNNPLKYHPGAVRAWEEAGYDVPDCAEG